MVPKCVLQAYFLHPQHTFLTFAPTTHPQNDQVIYKLPLKTFLNFSKPQVHISQDPTEEFDTLIQESYEPVLE